MSNWLKSHNNVLFDSSQVEAFKIIQDSYDINKYYVYACLPRADYQITDSLTKEESIEFINMLLKSFNPLK